MSYVFYEVKSGDQLFAILHQHYGDRQFATGKSRLIEGVRAFNPQITDINRIFPGQVIMLPTTSDNTTLPAAQLARDIPSCMLLSQTLSSYDSQTRDGLKGALGHLAENAGDQFLTAVEKATKSAVPEIRGIALDYYRKEAGMLTRGQYDYARRLHVENVSRRLGAFHQLINPGRQPNEVLRISRNATMRTGAIIEEANQLARISRVAKAGGQVLLAANILATAAEIGLADNDEERTTLLIDSVSGVLGGMLAVAVIGTPVGLVGLVVVIGVSTAGSAVAQALARRLEQNLLYDAKGQRITTSLDKAWAYLR